MVKSGEEYLHRIQRERQAEDKEPVLNFCLIPGALFHPQLQFSSDGNDMWWVVSHWVEMPLNMFSSSW